MTDGFPSTPIPRPYAPPRSLYLATAGVSLFLAVIVLGSILAPRVFWDGFVWKYVWGPVVADSLGMEIMGARAGYNPVNTALYAVLLPLMVAWIYVLFRRLRISFDTGMIISLLPFVVSGATYRVLEDMGVFRPPGGYLFIAPLIYLLLGAFALGTLSFSALREVMQSGIRASNPRASDRPFFTPLVSAIWSVSFSSIFVVSASPGSYPAPSPLSPVLLALLVPPAVHFSLRPLVRVEGHHLAVFSTGCGLLAVSLPPIVSGFFEGGGGGLLMFAAILILASAAAGSFLLAARLLSKRPGLSGLSAFALPTSILIMFGHMLDASATFVGVDIYGYREKHVLPRLLMGLTGTAAVMYLLKAAIIGLVVYILENDVRKEIKDATVLGLLRFTILVLGLAPGLRDALRISLGV
ncbi:MAG: DUF63 family protein [Thermoplasmata archaeon]|nr:DUF63 family protein [Thermoplasmata archaeon]